MGWEKGKYYTRSRKVNGRVVREYVGAGELGELAARVDALEREKRLLVRLEVVQTRLTHDKVAANLKVLAGHARLLARAALLAAGYHQHARGAWRKRRG
jgi:hypothetical protein